MKRSNLEEVKEAQVANSGSLSNSEKLWNEIKNVEIDIFSLPNQKVSDYVSMMPLDPEKLYLMYKVSAVIPSLETALGSKVNLEVVDKYIILTRKVVLG